MVMSKPLFLSTWVVISSLLSGCVPRWEPYELGKALFANSLNEAIVFCKQDSQNTLSEDLDELKKWEWDQLSH